MTYGLLEKFENRRHVLRMGFVVAPQLTPDKSLTYRLISLCYALLTFAKRKEQHSQTVHAHNFWTNVSTIQTTDTAEQR